jgi:hypothetical protein
LLVIVFVVSSAAGLSRADTAAGGPGAPTGLLVELLRYPARAVITDRRPEFGWIVSDPRLGAVQSAYQILVASSGALLASARGDLWDSGRRRSARSVNVEYAGKPLQEGQAYLWKVRTWDGRGVVGPWSAPQTFRTGRFSAEGRDFPAESRWVDLGDGQPGDQWVLENRQRAEYVEVPARAVRRLDHRRTLADFGQAAFATLRFVAESSRPDASLVVYLGERLWPDGSVHKDPGVSNIGFVRTTVALRPGRHEYTVMLPRHRAKMVHSQVLPAHMPEVTPYRYAELEPSDAAVRLEDLRQVALFYPFDDAAARFASSDERLDRLWGLCKHTLKATPFLALYADGNRERMPYEADSYIQQLGHYAVDREYAVARYTNQFLLHNPSWPTEWHMHAVFMAHADFMQTGDVEHLRANYADLRAKTLIALARKDGLISTRTGLVTPAVLAALHHNEKGEPLRDIVDWPPGTPVGQKKERPFQGNTPEGERDGYVFTDINTVVNAFHYRSLVLMADIARAVGNGKDAALFAKRARLVANSINEKLFDRDRGVYRDGEGEEHASLHASMFPLAFGLVPEKHRSTVVAHVKSRGMACSVYGAQYLLDGLYDAGEASHALALMTSGGRRSWLNMLRVGATMTTEAWDEFHKPNLTWNHAWGSAPANIVARKLMGVEPLAPGFATVRIKPQPADLRTAAVAVPTIRGPVKVDWRREGERFTLEVEVPANTRAELWLPGPSAEGVTVDDSGLARAAGVRVLGAREGRLVVGLDAGRRRFAGATVATESRGGTSSGR